jgi:NTP pyrophosphatase (non-canonical NTP hydrolase)
LKLIEEVGELAKAIRKDSTMKNVGHLKDSIEEELYDVLYYTLALANIYDADFDKLAPAKERLNDEKRGTHYADRLLGE